MSIPEANTNCFAYDQDSINVTFVFYGNSVEDIYLGHTKISPPLLKCTKESHKLKYAGYKSYICARFTLTAVKKYKSQKNNDRNKKRIASNP